MAAAQQRVTNQAAAAPPPIASLVLPAELKATGWKLERKVVNDDHDHPQFSIRNEKLQLATDPYKTLDEAIEGALILQTRSEHKKVSRTKIKERVKALTTSTNGHQQTAGNFIPELAIASIVIGTTNARKIFSADRLQELAASIVEKGILEPLIVRPLGNDRYELVAGERRFRAAKIAGLKAVPAIAKQLDDNAAAEIQVIENDQREDLAPLERAAGYQVLIDRFGHTPEALAAKLGKSKAFIYGFLKLNHLPPEAAEAVAKGTLPVSTAQLIGRIPNADLRAKAAEKILEEATRFGDEAMSFREAKDLLEDEFVKELKGAPFDQKSATLLPAVGSCEACPKRTGNNRAEFPDGRADICTDPGCYTLKVAAHEKQLLDSATAKGYQKLRAPKNLWAYSYGNEAVRVSGDAAYIDLADKCPADKQQRTYGQLLRPYIEPAQIFVGLDRRRKAHQLVEREVAKQLLKSEHKIEIAAKKSVPAKTSRQLSGQSPEHKAAEERREKLEAAVLAEASTHLFDRVRLSGLKDQVLQLLARTVIEGDLYDLSSVARVCSIGSKPFRGSYAAQTAIVKALPKMSKSELELLIVVGLLHSDPWQYAGNISEEKHREGLLKAYGLSFKTIEAQAAAEFDKAAAAAPAKTKKAKKR